MNGATTSNIEYQGKAYSVTTEMYFNQNYGEKPKDEREVKSHNQL